MEHIEEVAPAFSPDCACTAERSNKEQEEDPKQAATVSPEKSTNETSRNEEEEESKLPASKKAGVSTKRCLQQLSSFNNPPKLEPQQGPGAEPDETFAASNRQGRRKRAPPCRYEDPPPKETPVVIRRQGRRKRAAPRRRYEETIQEEAFRKRNLAADTNGTKSPKQAKRKAYKPAKDDAVGKFLDDGKYCKGRIISEEEVGVLDEKNKVWFVLFQDNEKQAYTLPELKEMREFEQARIELCYLMGNTEEEVLEALRKSEPPYMHNEVQKLIQQARKELIDDDPIQEPLQKFKPEKGLKIRKDVDGSSHNGVVTDNGLIHVVDGQRVKLWEVTFECGAVDDMDYFELFEWRANRPRRPPAACGRQFCALELFSGSGHVTQAFSQRQFRVQSIDIDPNSYATMKVDIMKLQLEDIGMIPDVIWASPPCQTYSNLAGKIHRDPNQGIYEKSNEAKLHNKFLMKLRFIVDFFKKKNPHLIVVIENPVGKLRKMPLMKQLGDALKLHDVEVNYCRFGRGDKKPTQLWTNEIGLCGKLYKYRCAEGKCPYFGQKHPLGTRGNGNNYNAAAVPMALAFEVARYAELKLYSNDVDQTKPPRITEEEREYFNKTILGEIPFDT